MPHSVSIPHRMSGAPDALRHGLTTLILPNSFNRSRFGGPDPTLLTLPAYESGNNNSD
jgi:hypothetical protein